MLTLPLCSLWPVGERHFSGFPIMFGREEEGRSDEKHLPYVEFPWRSPAL